MESLYAYPTVSLSIAVKSTDTRPIFPARPATPIDLFPLAMAGMMLIMVASMRRMSQARHYSKWYHIIIAAIVVVLECGALFSICSIGSWCCLLEK